VQDLNVSLNPLPPFRLDLTAWALRRRPINAIDSWDGEAYSRVLAINGLPVFIRIIQTRGLRSPLFQINAMADRLPLNAEQKIVEAVERSEHPYPEIEIRNGASSKLRRNGERQGSEPTRIGMRNDALTGK